MNKFLPATLFLIPISLLSQFYPVDQIPTELKKDAYAVIRSDKTDVQLNSINEFKYTNEVVISVLDKSGDSYVDAYQHYDPNTKIDLFEVEIFDGNGKSIKKFKPKDLSDASAVSGGQLYTDNRIKYLEFTPTFYPYTVRYKVTTTNKNTLSLPRWFPISNGNLAVEKSSYTFTNNTSFTLRHLEKNLENYNIIKNKTDKTFNYELNNSKPLQDEDYMINWRNIMPHVIIASDQINIDGTQGKFDNWNDYGKWSYQYLVDGKLDFTPAQKAYFRDLVKDAKTEKQKVAILYQYMQKKVRYIGVQLGIGGLSPFPNSYVESKSYGDCKALSNYMIGMLDAVGIKGYHTVLFANNNSVDIDDQMMYQQGNHMIVYVPLADEDIWIEATSQTSPFNHLGQFSGNRNVLIYHENGGKIIPSQVFDHNNNILTTKGTIEITLEGNAKIDLHETSKGLFYDDNSFVKTYLHKDQIDHFKRKFPVLAQPNINDIRFENDWENASFETFLKVTSSNFAKKQGNNLIFNLIPANNETSTLKKAKERNYDFHISRGYTDIMEFEIIVPENVKTPIQIQPIEIKSEFGSYHLTVEKTAQNKYILKRTYKQIKGNYEKAKFNDYVEFRRQVSANDNIKTLLEF
ncbi:DUF3857 domain-containing protein [Faecalibacter bovis]|uniref:DUF3857 domain-containing protein n=1 Tax=Faecalibacter bovis TaxID=2898187 RepID=A0ABX7XFX1_9FLAO|nr:DUF3857 domain-containing protein [Faecalibacter bovis]QTV06843.1 DUF3857 domain-containing protein [Faecalibacter bovis]